MVTPGRRRIFFALLFPVAVVVGLAAGELVVRAYIWYRGWTPNCYATVLDMYIPHPSRGNELKPNFRLKSGTFHMTTNSIGIRGPDVAERKLQSVKRIAMLGGSSVFGYYANDGQEAARHLERLLNQQKRQVEVINAGVPGYNLFQTASRFNEKVQTLGPEIVVLYLGWNDLPYICSSSPEQYRLRPIATSVERFFGKSALFGFVGYRLLGGTAQVAPKTVPAASVTVAGREQFRENLDEIGQAVEQSGAQLVVCTQCMAAHPMANEDVKRFVSSDPKVVEQMIELAQWLRAELQSFAERRNARFVDAYNVLPPDEQILADYIHFTAIGEQQLGKLLADEIAGLLR